MIARTAVERRPPGMALVAVFGSGRLYSDFLSATNDALNAKGSPVRASFRNVNLFPVAVVCMALAGCAGLGPGYETPTVSVNAFKALPSEGMLPNFEIGLEVINPNRDALKLAGMSYTISLDGHDIIKGVANDLPVIEAYGTGQVTVTATANLVAGIRLIGDLVNNPKENVEYRFLAKLDPGAFRPTIRIEDSGSLSAGSLGR